MEDSEKWVKRRRSLAKASVGSWPAKSSVRQKAQRRTKDPGARWPHPFAELRMHQGILELFPGHKGMANV